MALFHRRLLGLRLFAKNVLVPAEVDIGGRDVAEALVIASVVEHVRVNEGGQAIVGNVETGGRGTSKKLETTP